MYDLTKDLEVVQVGKNGEPYKSFTTTKPTGERTVERNWETFYHHGDVDKTAHHHMKHAPYKHKIAYKTLYSSGKNSARDIVYLTIHTDGTWEAPLNAPTEIYGLMFKEQS